MRTFDGTVLSPIYRGKVGDTFDFAIVNDGQMAHSLDFHAGMVSPSVAMVPIAPGGSHECSFVAKHAGIFMYRCGTPPVLQHIASGMYGAVIPTRRTFLLSTTSTPSYNRSCTRARTVLLPPLRKLFAGDYDTVVFNGYVNQYNYAPIDVQPGQRIRVWVIDDGPSAPSSL